MRGFIKFCNYSCYLSLLFLTVYMTWLCKNTTFFVIVTMPLIIFHVLGIKLGRIRERKKVELEEDEKYKKEN